MFGSGGGEGEGGWDQWVWGIKSHRWAEVVVLAGASYVTSQTKCGDVVVLAGT